MSDLNSLIIFARVVEANGFSEAARRLNMPISTVSRRVAELEDQLGVRLLERSTRNLRLTDIGQELLEHARRSLELSQAVDCIVSNQSTDVSGTLRLSSPPNVTDTLIAPLVSGFQASYPNVRVQVFVTERFVDHIAEGIDLALRIGPLKDSNLIARKILRYREQLVASPTYLDAHKPLETPEDLRNHRLLSFWYGKTQSGWNFVHVNGTDTKTIHFVPHLSINDFSGLATALIAGDGIGELPPIVQPSLIEDGKLVEVLPAWRLPASDVSLIHLANRHIPKQVRLFKEFAIHMAPILFPNLPS
jgi:DNA-binding transcriptional LysR family regulator